jgi:hypothetical protein
MNVSALVTLKWTLNLSVVVILLSNQQMDFEEIVYKHYAIGCHCKKEFLMSYNYE